MPPSELATPPRGVEITVLFDGECALCRREIEALRRRNQQGRVAFEDIAAPEFDPGRYGLERRAVMGRIHGVLPDGGVLSGMEVLRRAYAGVGRGWLLAPSRWPLLRPLFERGYEVFARNRLRWTGRSRSVAVARCASLDREP